jgi:CheY-like chemotaxis protein
MNVNSNKFNNSYLKKNYTKKKIMFIDDDPNLLAVSEMMLASLDYQPIMAEGGTKAIELLTTDIALIFLDLMMPDIYGLDVLKHIRQLKEYDHIPVILQTGATNTKDVSEAFRIGINAILLKPYKKQDLKEILDDYL